MEELFLLNKNISDYEKVVVYGAAEAGKAVFLKLLQHNVKVFCLTDSDPEKCNEKYLNIPVIHIDELDNIKEEAAVIVCGYSAFVIAEELKKRGFKHLFYDYSNETGILHVEREG